MFAQKIIIKGKTISQNTKPFLIAEMSGNHNGDIERAKKIIKEAKRNGADAIKLQTYTADTLTLDSNNPEFFINEGLWKGQRLYDLYSKAHTPWDWHEELFNYAAKIGIIIFSSPFDRTAVDLLEKLNTPAYKIASPEIVDLDLIDYVCKKNKPVFISTGMASLDEIDDAMSICIQNNHFDVVLMHCISAYPTPLDQSRLSNINFLKDKYSVLVGFSDHSLGTIIPTLSIANGARVIEKHFTLSKSDGGVDSNFSIELDDFAKLRQEIDQSFLTQTSIGFGPNKAELQSYKNRRSLYAFKTIKKGERFSHKNVKSVRPANGLKPKYLKELFGYSAKEEIKPFTPINWNLVNKNEA